MVPSPEVLMSVIREERKNVISGVKLTRDDLQKAKGNVFRPGSEHRRILLDLRLKLP
jgi:hypothetical protein